MRRLRFEGTLCVTLFDLRPAMPPFRGARLYFATPPRVQIDLAVEKVPFNLRKVPPAAARGRWVGTCFPFLTAVVHDRLNHYKS